MKYVKEFELFENAKVKEYIDKFNNKMSGSSRQTAAWWIDGISDLSSEEKKQIWNGIQYNIKKDANRKADMPEWVNESNAVGKLEKLVLQSDNAEGKNTGWMEFEMGADSLGDPMVVFSVMNKGSHGFKKNEIENLIKFLEKSLEYLPENK